MLTALTDAILARVLPHPVRVGIDGCSTAGKTSLADELAAAVQQRGRAAVRISLDDFKRPWSERHRYDRESAAGYYRNAYDYPLIQREVLEPLGPDGNLSYRSAHLDPLTQCPRPDAIMCAVPDTIALIEGVFLFRPELNRFWDFRIFVEIDEARIMERGVVRDQAWVGSAAATAALYTDRYIPSERLYLAEVAPQQHADVIVNNNHIYAPKIRWRQPE